MRAVPEFSFDLAIADEAHRCAGLETSRHKTILNENAIRCQPPLVLHGHADRLRDAGQEPRGEQERPAGVDGRPHAVRARRAPPVRSRTRSTKGLLCPYQVAVIPIDDDEVHELIKRRRIVTADGEHNLEAAGLATQIACARAMRRFGCRRIVAFHPSIVDSKRFSEHFPVAVGLLAEDDTSRRAGVVPARRRCGYAACHAYTAARALRERRRRRVPAAVEREAADRGRRCARYRRDRVR